PRASAQRGWKTSDACLSPPLVSDWIRVEGQLLCQHLWRTGRQLGGEFGSGSACLVVAFRFAKGPPFRSERRQTDPLPMLPPPQCRHRVCTSDLALPTFS